MGFFTGSLTLSRCRLTGQPLVGLPELFSTAPLEQLAHHAAGRQKIAAADGVECGWIAGTHILDTSFEMEKNVINDMLWFALRIDQTKLPADLLKAYYLADLKALAEANPSGRPSLRQKREAKESARNRLEEEAKDGRFLKRKVIECVWDRGRDEIYFGATSMTNVDRFATLFKTTFGHGFEPLSAGRPCENMMEMEITDAVPAVFVDGTRNEVAWVLDESSHDFLGNEFILWLWYRISTDDDTFALNDRSEATVMLARKLHLDCPRGQTGNDTLTHEGPTSLPEAMRAIQSGKLPRKVGMTLVRHGQQFEFTLHAESLAIASAKLPRGEEESERARLEERASRIRDLADGVDLLYGAFLDVRLSNGASGWAEELVVMREWLKSEVGSGGKETAA